MLPEGVLAGGTKGLITNGAKMVIKLSDLGKSKRFDP